MSLVIAVGTTSALKVRAIAVAMQQLSAFDARFVDSELYPLKTESGISDQPFGLNEMFKGADARARNAFSNCDAHPVFAIGIENGLIEINHMWFDLPAVVVFRRHPTQRFHWALGAALPVPARLVEEVRAGSTELGEVVQRLSGGGEKDPHKFLSKGALDREAIIAQVVVAAFCPFINQAAYKSV